MNPTSFNSSNINSQQIMRQLAAIKKAHPIKNPYQHHQLKSHSILRTKDKNSGVFVAQNLKPINVKKISNGRSFYFDQQAQQKIAPGPTYYQSNTNLLKSSISFKNKNTERDDNKVKTSIKQMSSTLGPGFYHYQDNDIYLSDHKKTFKTLMIKSPSRFKYGNLKTPGPSDYQNLKSVYKTSGHRNLQMHKMSVTKRSSLIKSEKVPGPGQYQWHQYFNKNKQKTNKPTVQYKFVYGHPS